MSGEELWDNRRVRLFAQVWRTQLVTGPVFTGGQVGGLAMLLAYERGAYLISPFDLLYFLV